MTSSTVGASVAGSRSSTPRRRGGLEPPALLGYLFIAPAVLLFILFVAVPFIAAMALAFFKWDLLTPAEPAGLTNFARLFTDPLLAQVLGTTFAFAFASVVTHLAGAMILALAVNRALNRVLNYFVRATIFFPFLISWAAVSLLWKYVLDPSFGYVAYYMGQIGIDLPNWFTEPGWSLLAIIGIDWWHTIGYTFIIVLAGLQTVPRELVEAAKTDGANDAQVFWNITLPLMSPTLFFATVITFIGAFQIFDPMQIITGGGPDNTTMSIVMYLYQTGFQAFDVGYASAIALLVFVVIMGVTVLQFVGARRWVHQS